MNSKMTKNETKQNMERRHYLTHGMIKANNKSANTERASEDTTSSHREHSRSNKLFFTTTDLLDKINSVLSSSAVAGSNIDPSKLLHQNNDEDDRHIPAAAAAPCFELQRRLPNGSTRKATTEEVAAADFQAKLKQSAQLVSQLSSREEKLQWAEKQRQAGNELFAQQQYQDAMDVYLTCLVAMEDIQQGKSEKSKITHDGSPKDGSSSEESSSNTLPCWKQVTEEQIQLPVLLNLSACTLKLAMYKKTKIFCDLAIDLPCGKTSPKAFFRRAKAQMSMGSYQDAKRDLVHCLDLVVRKNDRSPQQNDGERASDLDLAARVEKELAKLEILMQRAEANRQKQKEAMQRVFSGTSQKKIVDGNVYADSDDDVNQLENEFMQYDNKEKRREYSLLRAPWYYEKEKGEKSDSQRVQLKQVTITGILPYVQSLSIFAKKCIGRFVDWITRSKKRK